MHERQPQLYKNETIIRLDQYGGIARDVMSVNVPVSDRFMSVADVRRDIVVVQKMEERARDYDQIGDVRIGKILSVSRFNRRERLFDLRSDHDAWYIGIDDQTIARRTNEKKKQDDNFDVLFTEKFQREVNSGIRKILLKEKLLNGGYYDILLTLGYLSAGFFALNFAQMFERSAAENVIKFASEEMWAFIYNVTANKARSLQKDPFARRTLKECVLPVVPVDRLARGMLYLGMHGDKFIDRPKA
jgi:hypothetical protein